VNRGRLLLIVALATPSVAAAQVRDSVPSRRPQTPDSLSRRTAPTARPIRPDSTAKDTTIKWAPSDSVMDALLKRQGYTITRYQGGVVTFDAQDKALAIGAAGAKTAIVERDGQRVTTDSVIVYDDRTRNITVSGKFEIAPGGGQMPIAGSTTARYNLSERSGRIANARVTVEESGQRWFIQSDIGKTALGDSTRGVPARFYGIGGSLTSCDDSVPDYHFELKEIKRTQKTLVARPAVLYIRDVPVMWLPFVFQDIRPGRKSGMLPIGFGTSDIVRNNPNYHRYIRNIGYYWALSDYVDFATWIDWRSGVGTDTLDRGWTDYNAQWQYNWLDRQLHGRLATNYQREGSGRSKYSVSWDHSESFGGSRNINWTVNYTTNTDLQRRNTFNPYAAIATIGSTLNFADKLGPTSLQVGGSRTQYPGRAQIVQSFPSVQLSTPTINVTKWLAWTPNFRFSEQAQLHGDSPSALPVFKPGTGGRLVDTAKVDQNAYDRTIQFDTPIRIFGFDFQNGLSIHDKLNDFPDSKIVYLNADSAQKVERVFRRTFLTTIDWNPTFSLPPLFQNRFKLTPSISLGNVEGGPFWIRSEVSNGKFVHQSKRLTYGLSASPTIFGIFPGFGPFQRFRHALSPTISYSYAPAAKVDTEYIAAQNRYTQGYLGALPQSMVTFGLSQNIEAKVRARGDSAGSEGQKLKVLSMQFTPLSYDFERAHATGKKLAGLTTENFGSTLTSDLLPGFNVNADYSLFEGSTLSDTALFKPYMTRLGGSLHLSRSENPFTVLARMFGKAVPVEGPNPQTSPGATGEEQTLGRQMASQPIAGQGSRGSQFVMAPTKGWDANFNFSTSRQRPPKGDRVLQFDPRIRCEVYKNIDVFAYENCRSQPTVGNDPPPPTTAGSYAIALPRQTSLQSSINFEVTQKWSAGWQTSYDFELHQFAAQIVSLQRDLHDWRALFNFTRSPNGNFAFNFFIALKPQPDLKFDYSRATVRTR
jgi:hypothetical protein